MAWHASQILEEVVEARRNPLLAYLDDALCRRAAARLARTHGEAELREVFAALSELDDFPPANLLWNAEHRDVPLRCFLRIRVEPVFRVLRFEREAMSIAIVVEYGKARKKEATREEIVLCRDRLARLVISGRRRLA